VSETKSNEPLSALIKQIRTDIISARGKLRDAERAHSGFEERIASIRGLLDCGVIALYHIREEIVRFEIARDDAALGPHLRFQSRGIGKESLVSGCFICGAKWRNESSAILHNIAAFVSSSAEGEQLVGWFGGRAWLDYRESEPLHIQLKVGACDKHLSHLQFLESLTRSYNVIRACDITAAKNPSEWRGRPRAPVTESGVV